MIENGKVYYCCFFKLHNSKLMNTIHKEISVLNDKVDALQELVKNLQYQLHDFLTQNASLPSQETDALPVVTSEIAPNYSLIYKSSPPHAYHHQTVDHVIDDHTVLEDLNLQESHHHNSYVLGLSPDLQVQRLTAQLTAAYNRIAALEEQLLARRI